ncbi:hypothetical protein D3C83_117750 [compost metagenome]
MIGPQIEAGPAGGEGDEAHATQAGTGQLFIFGDFHPRFAYSPLRLFIITISANPTMMRIWIRPPIMPTTNRQRFRRSKLPGFFQP